MKHLKVVLIVAVSISFVSCTPSENKARPLRVGIDKFVGFAPIYLASETGIYAHYNNLQVDPQPILDTAARTSALQTGKIDALCTTADSLLLAASKGLDLVIVAAVDDSRGADGILVRKEITDVHQLKDQTVAFQEAMPSHFLLLWTLDKAGMQASDVLGVNMNADAAGTAFMAGKVPVAVTWEPYLSQAAAAGKGHVLVSSANYPGVLVDVIAVRRDVLERRHREVVALVRGWMDAVAAHEKDPQGTDPVMSKSIGIPLSDFKQNLGTLILADMKYNQTFFDRQSPQSIWRLGNEAVRIWQKAGVIARTQDFDPAKHITSDVIEEAARLK